ncbi:hypothetical protein BT67DRAFT_221034 [Trichocladium antarcticum]|uniref:Uncharacterized protein n=1 Tax=Trichocladium antarcticum TaxID=1450529 RepID=A0AAN6UC96_9PEZI|nr:hypothetical protein BT67DRAFT_221034 [Trichocladium antarcticum]
MIDAQEMRRRWTDKTNAVFGPRDRFEHREYAAESFEREFDFKGCRSIVFLQGERTGRETDVLLLTQGSGHMTLPAGVQVLVQSGYARCEAADSDDSGSTTVGRGVRAPAPSRVSGYALSSADSAYSGAATPRSHMQSGNASRYRPSPPRDAASFSRGSTASAYMSAANVPLPRSNTGRSSTAGAGDWEVVEQMGDYEDRVDRGRDDACTVVPDDSISSVGSRGYSRRASRDY